MNTQILSEGLGTLHASARCSNNVPKPRRILAPVHRDANAIFNSNVEGQPAGDPTELDLGDVWSFRSSRRGAHRAAQSATAVQR